jgi:hypothetical protein
MHFSVGARQGGQTLMLLHGQAMADEALFEKHRFHERQQAISLPTIATLYPLTLLRDLVLRNVRFTLISAL